MDEADRIRSPLILPPALAREMIGHARAGAPNEVCGVLAGGGGAVAAVYPVPNLDPDPRRYLMDPKGLLHAMLTIEHSAGELLGFYHSHPMSPPFPSETDRALAFYPEHCYAIVSLMDAAAPEIRFFLFRDGRFDELAVVGSAPEAARLPLVDR
ncbi:MAG: Mov34/MPN/PAD-1 family protein [Chloroflexota bacterium]